MESNGLLGGAGGFGGALSLDGVRDATITKSVFFNNSVAGVADAGGAVSARESTVKFAGVQFSQNLAASDGGAVAVFRSEVSWSIDAETCSQTDVSVDLTTTTEHCGQYIEAASDTCEDNAKLCANYNYDNPFVTDRSVLFCTRFFPAASVDLKWFLKCTWYFLKRASRSPGAGCACSRYVERYFVLTNVVTGEAKDVDDPVNRISGSKGTGVADGIRVWQFCLESGEYSIVAFDLLGEGW